MGKMRCSPFILHRNILESKKSCQNLMKIGLKCITVYAIIDIV